MPANAYAKILYHYQVLKNWLIMIIYSQVFSWNAG